MPHTTPTRAQACRRSSSWARRVALPLSGVLLATTLSTGIALAAAHATVTSTGIALAAARTSAAETNGTADIGAAAAGTGTTIAGTTVSGTTVSGTTVSGTTVSGTTVSGTTVAGVGVEGRVAVVGVPGLEWSDLDQVRTPNLWRLVAQGGSASLSTRAVPPPDRGVTCPTAGWLTVSAGQRAGTAGRGCPPPPTPQGTGEGATIPGWSDLAAYQASTGYNAVLGTLGQLVADAGGKVAAIGPGAALAAADKTGNIANYADTPEAVGDKASGDLGAYNLIVFEASSLADAWQKQPLDEYGVPLPLSPATRQAAVAEADRRIGGLLGRIPAGTTVLVAGVSDVTPNAHLHVAIATGPSPNGQPYRRGFLTATSTRQDGLVTITDLTATAIHLLGLSEPRDVVGRTWENGGAAPESVADTVTELADSDLASQVLRDVRGPFFAVFVTVQLLFYVLAALALRRRRKSTPATAQRAPQDHGPETSAPPATISDNPGAEGEAPQSDTPMGEEPATDGARPGATSDIGADHAGTTPDPQTDGPGSAPDVPMTGPESTPDVPKTDQGTAPDARETPPGSASDAQTDAGSVPDAQTGPETVPDAQTGPGAVPDAQTGPGAVADAQTGPGAVADAQTGPGAVADAQGAGGSADRSGNRARPAVHRDRLEVTASLGVGEDAAASRVLVAVQVVAVVSGAIAISTFLAQLVPWWSLGAPMVALIVTILGFAGAITAVAFAGPWRSHVLGPLTIVAGVSSVALLIDVMTGSTLQVNAVTGYEPVTGGRFYGFSNIAFAVYATGTILFLAGVGQWLRERGLARPLVVLICAAYGGLAVFADGWPSWGADFGGVPAFVIGVAVLLILLAGRRVSVLKLLVVGVAGAVLIGAIAVFDWLRPEEQRTHLGTFVQQVLDGQAWTVVGRKFSAMVGVTVGNWSLTLLSLVALAFLFLVLDRPSRWGASALGQAYRLAPTLRAGLFGALACAFIGFISNDSGIAIPAMALTVAVPLTLAACVRALQLARPTTPARPSTPAASRERPGTSPRS